MTQKKLRIRRSLRELEKEYENGNKTPLETLMRAWKGIQELPPNDPKSFFKLGGYHGEPFRGPGATLAAYWGGYCNHGNVLFPTWHRVYCFKIEEALRSIPGCSDVTLPYWDETDEETLTKGIPWSLTEEYFELDGKKIPNPLYSYTFPVTITDNWAGEDHNMYTKRAGYQTVRYPLSGLVGNKIVLMATERHNSQFLIPEQTVPLLNKNVMDWLNKAADLPSDAEKRLKIGVHEQYKRCLDAPNYTIFSNTTSAGQWNDEHQGEPTIIPLEQPHNNIHIAVGGFEAPGQVDFDAVEGANGDMGENDTAALDPIFYFHHCNVDRMFWVWQKKHGHTDHLDVIFAYPGTNSIDAQGPTAGMPPNTWLNLDTPLEPFILDDKGKGRFYSSMDCINIETQLGYTYSKGSLDDFDGPQTAKNIKAAPKTVKKVCVTKLNKAPIGGSFVISAHADIKGQPVLLGFHSVLSRWSVQGCANCQTHLEVKAFFDLDFPEAEGLKEEDIHIEVTGRKHIQPALSAMLAKGTHKVEIR